MIKINNLLTTALFEGMIPSSYIKNWDRSTIKNKEVPGRGVYFSNYLQCIKLIVRLVSIYFYKMYQFLMWDEGSVFNLVF